MEKVHFYALNYSPCEPSSYDAFKKSIVVNHILKHYQNKCNEPFETGEIRLFSFRPKNSNGYEKYVEEFIYEDASKPCVLIFKSVFDIASDKAIACSRLSKYLREDFIKSVYFSDYNISADARDYLDFLLEAMQQKKSTSKVTGKRREYFKELRDAVKLLREDTVFHTPVCFKDISEVTGYSQSTLKSPFSLRGSNIPRSDKNGRNITQSEIDNLNDLIETYTAENVRNVDIFEETYKVF